jgi:glycerol-3-phosphate acyltransferase PlsY
VVEVVGILVLAFLAGSVPCSNIAARRARGVDLRDVGTGTVSGSSLYRVAGFVPLAIAGVFDVAKGAVGPLLAGSDRPVLAAFSGGLAVVGHNWSPFLRGAGGRGVAPALGALLVTAWPGAVLLLGGLVAGKLFGQTGLGGFVAEVALTPVLAVTNGAEGALVGVLIALPMLTKRVLGNGRPADGGFRAYGRRLLFDHDDAAVP